MALIDDIYHQFLNTSPDDLGAAVKEHKQIINDPLLFDRQNSTMLHIAAKTGELALITALVKNGADIEARDITGKTPLHRAASMCQFDAVRLLINLGADPMARDDGGRIPLVVAQKNNATREGKEMTVHLLTTVTRLVEFSEHADIIGVKSYLLMRVDVDDKYLLNVDEDDEPSDESSDEPSNDTSDEPLSDESTSDSNSESSPEKRPAPGKDEESASDDDVIEMHRKKRKSD